MSGSVFLFNPDNDMALATFSPYYKSPAGIVKMASDLESLPLWIAGDGDFVKVNDAALVADFATCADVSALGVNVGITDRFLDKPYSPWGWNPALAATLRGNGVGDENLPSDEWLSRYRALSGRNHYAGLLEQLRYIQQTCGLSQVCDSLSQVVDFMHRHEQVVLKTPWSGSGRGLMKLSLAGLTPSAEGWILRTLRTQGCIMAEPLYNKVCDFAMEFRSEGGAVSFVGYSLFETDSHGNYKGNLLVSDAAVEERICSFVSADALRMTREALLRYFSDNVADAYSGYFGVDMMVCRDADGGYKLHPLVEVNLRMNMGVVSRLFYNRFVDFASNGTYCVEYYCTDGEALSFHRDMAERYPLQVIGGKIKKGYLSLTPVSEETRYQIYVAVEEL